jgi:hypothetical protein
MCVFIARGLEGIVVVRERGGRVGRRLLTSDEVGCVPC